MTAPDRPDAPDPTPGDPAPPAGAAVAGWLAPGPEPRLLGSTCTTCGVVAFPPVARFCPNPSCRGREFAPTELSPRGTVWSYTDAAFRPPPPYVPRTDPYQPFGLVAVELAAEQLVVLGPLAEGVGIDRVEVGTEVELVVEALPGDDDGARLMWAWRPTGPDPDGHPHPDTPRPTAGPQEDTP